MKLHFNLLPFRYAETGVIMCFSPYPLEGYYPFTPAEVPPGLPGMMPRRQLSGLYYCNVSPAGQGVRLPVKLAAYPSLARAWCMQRIRQLLEPVVDFCLHAGPYTTHFWCSTARTPGEVTAAVPPADDTNTWQGYHRITLKVVQSKSSPHPELLLGYDGIGFILKYGLQTLMLMNPSTKKIPQVAYRGRIYRWEERPENASYELDELLPLLCDKVAAWMGSTALPKRVARDNGNGCAIISAFLQQHLLTAAFQSVAVHDGRLREVRSADTGHVATAGGPLLFGQQGVAPAPAEGMAAHGPLKLPPGNHHSCFIICSDDDKHLASKLFDYIIGTSTSRQLRPFIRVPMSFSHTHTLFLSSDKDAEEQVVQYLKEMEFPPEITWCVFLICRGGTEQQYAGITGLLLHREVLVQQVEAADLEGDFTGPSRLLGIDVVTRLGGTPWRPAGCELTDAVAGFAVPPNSDTAAPGAGAAVFFAPGGLFAGANTFNPDNELEWGGLSVEFLRKRMPGQDKVRRLVLHVPRQLKPHELEALQRMIGEQQVVVMTIRRSRSSDIGVIDSTAPGGNPPDGTWVRCSQERYLLFTQRHRRGTSNASGNVVPLTVRFRILNAGSDTTESLAPGLLSQLHALTRMHHPPAAASHLPVTLTWAARLADRISHFRNKALPEYGNHVPWFI